MITSFANDIRRAMMGLVAPVAVLCAMPALAQDIQTIDPDAAIDGDLMDGVPDPDTSDQVGGAWDAAYESGDASERYQTVDPVSTTGELPVLDVPTQDQRYVQSDAGDFGTVETLPGETAEVQTTYAKDDLIGAAEGLFGEGAEGLARLIQNVLSDQGEPNGYIVGREGGGAFIFGVRYGSGTLYHAVEGNMPVYWTGPSLGPDVGANAGNTFTLVYNLHDTEQLYERFPSGEGQAYFVGGFTASYVRKGDVVLIPIRVGAGLRLGVNAGYMRFSKEQRWLPF